MRSFKINQSFTGFEPLLRAGPLRTRCSMMRDYSLSYVITVLAAIPLLSISCTTIAVIINVFVVLLL